MTEKLIHVLDALHEVRRRNGAAIGVPAQRGHAGDADDPFSITVITDPAAYVDATMRRTVDDLATMAEGGRNAAVHAAARTVGRLAGGGLPIAADGARQALEDACRRNGLVDDDGLDGVRASIRSGFAFGNEHPLVWEQAPRASATVTAETVLAAPVSVDGDTALLDAEVRAQRIKRRARRLIDAEESAETFVPVALKRGDAFLAEQDPPVTWAVEQLAQVGHNVLLTAGYKTGKTTLLGDLIRALCDGVPFLGTFPVSLDLGRVAALDYELDASQHRRWLRDTGVVQADRFVVGHWRGVRGRFDDERNVEHLIEQLGEAGARTMILDPFAAAAKGVDENDNGAVGAFLNLLDYVKERAGVSLLILSTHTGRREADMGQERARGATRLDDWPDVRWLLTKGKGGADEEDSERRFFSADGRDVHLKIGALDYDPDSRRLTFSGKTPGLVRQQAVEDRVLAFIKANPQCSGAKVERGVKGGADPIRKALESLTRGGHLAKAEDSRSAHYTWLRDRYSPPTNPADPFS